MELRINPYQTPEQITFNYEELKEMLLAKVAHYETIVYNDDQIKDAKADRANLNRLKKALNDERIRREKEYMESFNVFKAQVNEIIKIIDKPVAVIDQQIKAFEDQQKADKYEKIFSYWADVCEANNVPDSITFEKIFNEKWLNASVSMKSIQDEINAKLEAIAKDLVVVRNLPAYAFEAEEVYMNTLDLAKAVSESYRLKEIEERKAAWEADQAKRKAEMENAGGASKSTNETLQNIASSEKTWIGFQALLSVEDAKSLKDFFVSRGIQYKSI